MTVSCIFRPRTATADLAFWSMVTVGPSVQVFKFHSLFAVIQYASVASLSSKWLGEITAKLTVVPSTAATFI